MSDNSHIPERILTAIEHVRSVFPICSMVVFNSDCRWQYMGEDFQSISFKYNEIDMGILEAAADAAFEETTLPCVFQLKLDDEED